MTTDQSTPTTAPLYQVGDTVKVWHVDMHQPWLARYGHGDGELRVTVVRSIQQRHDGVWIYDLPGSWGNVAENLIRPAVHIEEPRDAAYEAAYAIVKALEAEYRDVQRRLFAAEQRLRAMNGQGE